MIGWILAARARRLPSAMVAIVLLGVLEHVVGAASIRLTGDDGLSVPWVVVIPVATATVAGTCARSAVAVLEAGCARPLSALRLVPVLALLMLGVMSAGWGSAGLAGHATTELGAAAAVRNLVGFGGLALLSAAVLGGALAWVLPVSAAVTMLAVGAPEGTPHRWAWAIAPSGDRSSWLMVLILVILGMATIGLRGTREGVGNLD